MNVYLMCIIGFLYSLVVGALIPSFQRPFRADAIWVALIWPISLPIMLGYRIARRKEK